MTKNEIIEKIEALKNQISDLEKEVEKVGNEGEKKYPVDGTAVYFVTGYGLVSCHTWADWSEEETERRMKLLFDSGERFLTKKDAEEYAEIKQIERELYALADDDKEWDGLNPHYSLYYSHRDSSCHAAYEYTAQGNAPHFTSTESALKAVETVGEERVIKWLTYRRKRPEV